VAARSPDRLADLLPAHPPPARTPLASVARPIAGGDSPTSASNPHSAGSRPAIAGSFIGGFQMPANPPRASIVLRRHLKPFTKAVLRGHPPHVANRPAANVASALGGLPPPPFDFIAWLICGPRSARGAKI
jgi:hypothetical protein